MLSCLICDDDLTVRQMTEFVFEKFTNVNCFVASSGEEAVEMANIAKLDFVLMDIHLPTMSGIQAASIIKKLQPDSIILGYTADPDMIPVLDKKVFTSVLHKVLRMDEIQGLVNRIQEIKDV